MLKRQTDAVQETQRQEQGMMRDFSTLAEEHVAAAAAPLREAQHALEQVCILGRCRCGMC